MISWWMGLLFGLLGAAVADGTKYGAIMINQKKYPFSKRGERAPFMIGLLVRWACGATVCSVVALQQIEEWSNQPLALFLVGVASPTVVQGATRLGRTIIRAIMAELSGGGGSGAV